MRTVKRGHGDCTDDVKNRVDEKTTDEEKSGGVLVGVVKRMVGCVVGCRVGCVW